MKMMNPETRRYRRRLQLGLLGAFGFALWIPLLVMLAAPVADISRTEQRTLAAMPELEWTGDGLRRFPGAFESFFNDHFGLRDHLIYWYSRFTVQVLKDSPTRRVLIGRDGWLYLGGHPHMHHYGNRWPLTDSQLRRWAEVLSAKHEWLAERDVRYLMVFVPDKFTVYPEYRPEWIRQWAPFSRLDQIVDYLREHTDVPILDLREPLLEAKEELRIYHKTDTHWNAWGAYVSVREIFALLSVWFPGFEPVERLGAADFGRLVELGGDLANMLALPELLTEEIMVAPKRERCARHLSFDHEPTNTEMVHNVFEMACETGQLDAIIFRDSYILEQLQFLADNFRHSVYVNAAPTSFEYIQDLVERHSPDLVIEQRVERWLRTPEG
jgi:alginate O-acetyltransferase complex protein AlgJ